jgi:hypothetical protein
VSDGLLINLAAIENSDHMTSPHADKYDCDGWYRATITELIKAVREQHSQVSSIEYSADLRGDRAPRPKAFIQWKGTDVCLDFHCTCGEQGHIDDDFAYYVQCMACGAVYEMPVTVPMRRLLEGEEPRMEPKVDDGQWNAASARAITSPPSTHTSEGSPKPTSAAENSR